jgi:hypothetical protein
LRRFKEGGSLEVGMGYHFILLDYGTGGSPKSSKGVEASIDIRQCLLIIDGGMMPVERFILIFENGYHMILIIHRNEEY